MRYSPPRILLAALAILTQHPAAAQSPRYETLYSFKGSPDGADPKSRAADRQVRRTLRRHLRRRHIHAGHIFCADARRRTALEGNHSPQFHRSDGQYPESTLVFGGTGALYGTTIGGGGGAGAIFEMAPPSTSGGTWTETVLYAFAYNPGNNQNVTPNGTVLIGPGGTLYATLEGSNPFLGLVSALVPPSASGGDWTKYELYSFGGAGDSGGPAAGVASEDGSLFGTTADYGADGNGVAFQLTPGSTHSSAWTETAKLHMPSSPLVLAESFTARPGPADRGSAIRPT